MSLLRFEGFLKNVMGLDTSSVGSTTIERAVRERASSFRLHDLDAYWSLLNTSGEERQALIEAVVVPETWFFRDPGAFHALGSLAATRRLSAFRVLSLPCSTGEEAYSIAMTLLDASLDPARFSIDAVDISERALATAREGIYRRNSFRSADQSFRDRHFDRVGHGDAYQLVPRVRECVRFHQSNLFAIDSAFAPASVDAIFCRNLLIYFDRETQERAISVLRGLLAEEGVLFVAPSETSLMLNLGFEPQHWPLAFAFRARPQSAQSVQRARLAARKPRTLIAPPSGPVPFSNAGWVPKDSGKAPPRKVESASQTPAAHPDVLDRARRLADQGQLVEARQACEAVIREYGPSAPVYYLLGLLEDSIAAHAQAIACYRRALYLDPKHHEALVHLITATERSGDVQAARQLRERAQRMSQRGAS